MTRMLFHALNGTGLGHQRRAALIASAVRSLGADVLVVTEAAPGGPVDAQGLPSERVPLVSAVFDPVRGPAAQRDFHRIVERFDPDLVVHDTHFLREVVRDLASAGRRQALVLRFTNAASVKNLLGGASAARMSVILVPYDREFLSGLKPELVESLDRDPRVRFTGPVVEHVETDSALAERYELGTPTVLVSAGAGGKPGADSFYTEALEVARSSHDDVRFLFVLGPLSKLDLPSEPGIRIVREEPRLRALLKAFTAAMLMPGYNGLYEAMAARLPSVVWHARQLYSEDPGPLLARLESRGCLAVAQGRRSLGRRLSEILTDPARRARMAAAWPDVEPAAVRAAVCLMESVQ